jgi:hypothetical protein
MSDNGKVLIKNLAQARRFVRHLEDRGWPEVMAGQALGTILDTLEEHGQMEVADLKKPGGFGISIVYEVKPPKGFLIDWLVPADRADDMLLALQKAFEERWVPKYGVRRARRMFLWHAVWSVIGFWINWMMKHLRLLKFLASGRG